MTVSYNRRRSVTDPKKIPGFLDQEHQFIQQAISSTQGTLDEITTDVIYAQRSPYNMPADGVAVDHGELQGAIDAAIAAGPRSRVMLGAGDIITSDTIHAGYGNGSFNSVAIEGEGPKYRGFGTLGGTAIHFPLADRQCVNFQGARSSSIKSVALVGTYSSYVDAQQLCLTTPLKDDTLSASWDDIASGIVDSRYAPHAGITVDAYSGVQPASHYPVGVQQYGRQFSSDVRVENVYIGGFNTGVANQPCDADGNGDFTLLRSCYLEKCKWGVSVGNTQSRNLAIEDVKGGIFYSVLTNNQHGRQQGKFGSTIKDLSTFAAINLFQFGAFYWGPITFDNYYAELLWKLGTITQAGTRGDPAMIFVGGEFSLGAETDARGVPAWLVDGGNSACVMFNGTTFSNYPSVCGIQPSNASFDGSFFRCDTRTNSYEQYAHNATAGGLVTPLLQVNGKARIKSTHYNLDTGVNAPTPGVTDRWQYGDRSSCIPFYGDQVLPKSEETGQIPNLQALTHTPNSSSKASLSSLTLVNKTLTITFTARAEDVFLKYGPLPGDVLIDDQTGMVFFVRSRVALVVIAEAQNNYKSDGLGGFTPLVAFSTTVGNLYFKSSRHYTPSTFLRGDATSGSAILTNCARDDGVASYDTEIAVGDLAIVYDGFDRWADPASAIITARSQAAQTITLTSSSGVRTQTRRPLQYFARTGPANV